jgi:FtsP/CotA-like multicopper oxidase with cupredoxin domain
MKTLLAQILQGAGFAALGSVLSLSAHAAAPGITGSTAAGADTFNLDAADTHITQPDGTVVYSWGYGCSVAPAGFAPAAPATPIAGATCPTVQLPGPTLIVTEGDVVTVNLTNNLPAAAGNTSILFPGFQVTSTGGTTGVLAQEAPNASLASTAGANTVTYTFTASTPGTHAYYSGTQGDLQIEMGLSGALIVLPKTPVTTGATAGSHCVGLGADAAKNFHTEGDFRLSTSAYDHPASCYDREYLFQFSEMMGPLHLAVEQQVLADKANKAAGNASCTSASGCLVVSTEPYVPNYFMINGRSMPDDMDPNYAPQYPSQPYNGNPHMHPGELTLLRVIGQGHMQHPFHEHANHVRILARDGNLLLDPTAATAPNAALPAGPLLFTTTTTPGLAFDGIFYWTGRGLNWDVFGHGYAGDTTPCVPDANGYYTVKSDGTTAAAEPNYYEWCGDHTKALEKNPFGQVNSGGPATLPDPTIVVNGLWYGGSPYLGAEATARAVGNTPLPVVGTTANNPATEAGYAYMWHSHNEREITTNNIFPGGMLMMMLIDARSFQINESN